MVGRRSFHLQWQIFIGVQLPGNKQISGNTGRYYQSDGSVVGLHSTKCTSMTFIFKTKMFGSSPEVKSKDIRDTSQLIPKILVSSNTCSSSKGLHNFRNHMSRKTFGANKGWSFSTSLSCLLQEQRYQLPEMCFFKANIHRMDSWQLFVVLQHRQPYHPGHGGKGC